MQFHQQYLHGQVWGFHEVFISVLVLSCPFLYGFFLFFLFWQKQRHCDGKSALAGIFFGGVYNIIRENQM